MVSCLQPHLEKSDKHPPPSLLPCAIWPSIEQNTFLFCCHHYWCQNQNFHESWIGSHISTSDFASFKFLLPWIYPAKNIVHFREERSGDKYNCCRGKSVQKICASSSQLNNVHFWEERSGDKYKYKCAKNLRIIIWRWNSHCSGVTWSDLLTTKR